MTDEHYKKLPWYFWLTGVEWLLLTFLVVALLFAGYQTYRLDQVTDERDREKRWNQDIERSFRKCTIQADNIDCGNEQ